MKVVCCFLEHDGKFLIVARHNSNTQEYEWDVPAAYVIKEENDKAAVLRVLSREVGYVASLESLVFLGDTKFVSADNNPYTMMVYQIKVKNPFATHKGDANYLNSEWVSPEECLAKQALIKNLDKLLKFVGYVK